MTGQFFYQEKGNFMQSLHPAAALAGIGVLLVVALLFSHPFYLIAIMIMVAITIGASDGLAAWEGYMKFALGMTILIMLINPLVCHAGSTVLWQGPDLPLLGRLTVTLEAIGYGAVMGVRLLIIISVFCLYNQIIHPDRLLNIFPRFINKSALVISLATRLFPVMAASMNNIREIQQLRGVDFRAGTLKERTQKYFFMFNILLVSSLEGSLEMAEAMQARAFGSGPRSYYRRDYFRPRDWLCLGGSLLAAGAAIYGAVNNLGIYSFYSQTDNMAAGNGSLLVLAVMMGGLSIPALLSWGWQHCRYLKSKI